MVTVHGIIYMFGGQGKRLYNDLYKLDPATGTFTEVQASGKPPTPRRGHSLVWDGRDNLVCFGGINSTSTDNQLSVFCLSRGTWFTPQSFGPAPSARTQHTAQLISPGTILIFGGCNSAGTFFNDALVLDTRTFTWHKPALLNTAPAPRYHHTCSLVNGKIVIYGGINSKQTFDGVVVLETKFMSDISSVAEELFRMTADASTMGGGVAVAPGAMLGSNHQPGQTFLQGSAAWQACPSLGASSTTGGGNGSAASPIHVLQMPPGAHAPQRNPSNHSPLSQQLSQQQQPQQQAQAQASHRQTQQPPPVMVVPGPHPLTDITSIKSLDAVKVQLTDLLLRRNLEEQHMQTARRAETTESLLVKEREAREAAQRELLQHKLMLTEAEADRAAAQQQLQTVLGRATREAAAAVELRREVDALQAKLAAREEELQEARLLQDGLVKELGIMASRYSRLAMDVQDGGSNTAAAAGGGGSPPAAGAGPVSYNTRRSTLASMAAGPVARRGGTAGQAGAAVASAAPAASTGAGDEASPEAAAAGTGPGTAGVASGSHSQPLPERSPGSIGEVAAAGLPLSTVQCIRPAAGSRDSTGPADLAPASPHPHSASCQHCCQQLLGLLSDSELHRSTLLEANQSLSEKMEDLASQNAQLRGQLRQMLAEAEALEPLPPAELEQLERKLEGAARAVRDVVTRRKIAEAQRRSNAEQSACAVCMEGPKAVVFNCGHQSCEACSGKMSACPFCRVAITARIRLYDT